MIPQIGQIYQINKNENNENRCAWIRGEIETGLVLETREENVAEMYDMREYGPVYTLWINFLVGDKTIWLPYYKENFSRIL